MRNFILYQDEFGQVLPMRLVADVGDPLLFYLAEEIDKPYYIKAVYYQNEKAIVEFEQPDQSYFDAPDNMLAFINTDDPHQVPERKDFLPPQRLIAIRIISVGMFANMVLLLQAITENNGAITLANANLLAEMRKVPQPPLGKSWAVLSALLLFTGSEVPYLIVAWNPSTSKWAVNLQMGTLAVHFSLHDPATVLHIYGLLISFENGGADYITLNVYPSLGSFFAQKRTGPTGPFLQMPFTDWNNEGAEITHISSSTKLRIL